MNEDLVAAEHGSNLDPAAQRLDVVLESREIEILPPLSFRDLLVDRVEGGKDIVMTDTALVQRVGIVS